MTIGDFKTKSPAQVLQDIESLQSQFRQPTRSSAMLTTSSIAIQIELKKKLAEFEVLMRNPEPSQEKVGLSRSIEILASRLATASFVEYAGGQDSSR